jgi:hypothetical protein
MSGNTLVPKVPDMATFTVDRLRVELRIDRLRYALLLV